MVWIRVSGFATRDYRASDAGMLELSGKQQHRVANIACTWRVKKNGCRSSRLVIAHNSD
jgi:hypothetical protein